MSLPTPKLDDRDWDDLVDEAKRRIAAKCPQWTDFNPSDPGMMLVELMAWMTETVFYRLNRVPEQNYIKFLELIGVRLQPARPARTWIFFRVQSGTKEEDLKPIPAGTPISTLPQRDRDPVTFTTLQDLVLTARKIIKTGSRYGKEAFNEREEIQNLCGETPWETDIFPSANSDLARGQAVPHHLYLGDPALGEFGTQNIVLRLLVEVVKPMKGQLFLDWQASDGETWQTILPEEDTTAGLRNNGTLVFENLPAMKKCDLAQLEQVPAELGGAFWLRARLIGSTMEELPTLLKVEPRIDLKGCTIRPLTALVEAPAPQKLPQNLAPTPVETGTDFCPLGIKAETGSAFYLGSDLFQKHGATITIQFDLREVLRPKRIAIHWEYDSQDRNWKPLGVSTQSGVATSQYKLQDGTNAFTRSGKGKVEFQCPKDVETFELGGQSGLFIRSRVEDAEFENDSDAKLVVKSIWLGFANEVRPWPFSLSKNYSEFKSHPLGVAFIPFRIEASRDPAFYLCFDDRPSSARGPYHLFLDVVPQTVNPDKTGMSWEYDAPNGWEWRPTEPPVKPQGAVIKWEYSAPTHQGEWKPLDVQDGTEGFVHEGMLKFHCPRDWKETREFEQSGFWLRVRWEIAEFLHPPRLRRVQLNVAEAEQAIKQERDLGSSTGLANQSFSLYTSILAYPEIWVRESGVDLEVSALERIPNAGVVKEADGYWVKWTEVRNFFGSQRDDRHFTVHLEDGTFEFGDDQRGRIPPQGQANVFVSYRVTEGSAGNVGANTIIVLEKAPPQIQGVTNVHPAEGGYDRESIEKAKQRGPWEIRHRDRAVTEDDFIELAKKASPLVGRAECYGENGVIHIIIVPNDDGEKPHPSQRLITDVRDYLEGRRLINACIKVRGPVYEAIDVEVEVVLDTRSVGDFSEVKRQIEESLRRFVHPLKGTDDGRGWPIGRTLHLSELYYRLEKLEGVDHVETLRICKRGTGDWGDRRIRIGSHSFPCFSTEMRIDQSFG